MTSQTSFTRAQKAAAILVAIGKPRASQLLRLFKKEEIRVLIEAAHSLTAIEQPDLEKLVAEFENDFAIGTGLLDSSEQLDAIVTDTLTPEEMAALQEEEVVAAEPVDEDIWAVVDRTEPEKIAEFIASESPQVAAFVLSRLSTTKSADVIAGLERDKRAQVLTRMMSMKAPLPKAVEMIEARLQALLMDKSDEGAKENQVRVAGILNELERDATDELLSDLSGSVTEDNVSAVKSMLFRFEDIINIEPAFRSALFDQISNDVMVLALQNCDEALAEAILSSIGQRTRRMIESELKNPPNTKESDIAAARRTIVSFAQKLANEGTISLPKQELEAA